MDLRDAKLSEIETSLRQGCELIRAHTSPAEIRAIVEELQANHIPALLAIEAAEGEDPAALFPELKAALRAVYYCNSLVDMGGLVDAVEAEVNAIFGAAEGTVPIKRRRFAADPSAPVVVEFSGEQKALLIKMLRDIWRDDDNLMRADIETLAEMWGVTPMWGGSSDVGGGDVIIPAGAEVVPIETYKAEEGQVLPDLGGGGSASGALEGGKGE